MSRAENNKTPIIINGILYSNDETGIYVDTHRWFEWLDNGLTFSLNTVTFRAEMRRKGLSWYAFKKIDGKLHKKYAGRTPDLSSARLLAVVVSIISG